MSLLNKVISERFQSHFSEYALMKLKMIFCLNLCIYMDKSLVVFWKSFLVLLRFFWVNNAKNNIFENKCFFSKMFYQIKMQAATNWSSHLKKQQTFHFFQTTDFLCNFQKSHFSEIFENHQ